MVAPVTTTSDTELVSWQLSVFSVMPISAAANDDKVGIMIAFSVAAISGAVIDGTDGTMTVLAHSPIALDMKSRFSILTIYFDIYFSRGNN